MNYSSLVIPWIIITFIIRVHGLPYSVINIHLERSAELLVGLARLAELVLAGRELVLESLELAVVVRADAVIHLLLSLHVLFEHVHLLLVLPALVENLVVEVLDGLL